MRRKNSKTNLVLALVLAATMFAAMIAGFAVGGKTTKPIEAIMDYIRNTSQKTDPEDTEWIGDDTADTEDTEETLPGEDDTTDEGGDPPDTTSQSTGGPDDTTDDISDTTQGIIIITTNDDTDPADTTKKIVVTTKETTAPRDSSERYQVPEIKTPDPRVSDDDYFCDALFLGDSRIVGLASYGRTEGATYYGRTSMSASTAFSASKTAETYKNSGNLEQFLTKLQFGKIYIMLGVNNEIGCSDKVVVKNFTNMLTKIRNLQPDAAIILISNFHVTAKKEQSSGTFTNAKVEHLNDILKTFADNKSIFYLDIENLYDIPGTGYMDPNCTRDGIHFYAKYYYKWRDAIEQKGKF